MSIGGKIDKNEWSDFVKRRAVVIIHGFGGNETEIFYLYNYLKQRKMAVYWIRLTGHDGSKKNFSKAHYTDWLSDVKDKLVELEKSYQQITCIGFSMGGLLSLQQSDRLAVDQVILCNTPIYLYNFSIILKDLLTFGKEERFITQQSLQQVSFHACLQFLKLLRQTKRKVRDGLKTSLLSQLLIIQNKQDEITYYRSAYYFLKYSHNQATLKLYEGGRHLLFLGENKTQAAEDILAFILAKDSVTSS